VANASIAMKTIHRILLLSAPALLLVSCASMGPGSSVTDDVYYMPSQAPVLASTAKSIPLEETAPPAPVQEDYYDQSTSREVGMDHNRYDNYYDMAYNDPYYYNYGRFGFNAAPMGWQTGWNGPGWGGGMSMGFGYGYGWGNGVTWGFGSGIYSGWYRPSWRYDPFYWNSPWGWGSPWAYNGWGYGAGYGYGNYHSPWGNCYGCYAPVIIGDGVANTTVVRPRQPIGGRNGSGTTGGVRNPVGLAPMPSRSGVTDAPVRREVSSPSRQQPTTSPTRGREGNPTHTREHRMPEPSRNVERSAPSRGTDFGGGGGSRTSPSRDGGGGRTSPGRR